MPSLVSSDLWRAVLLWSGASKPPHRSMSDRVSSVASFVDREAPRQRDFLAQIVRIASDNPPGDCAAAAARAEILLTSLGLTVEAHPVPESDTRANGMI